MANNEYTVDDIRSLLLEVLSADVLREDDVEKTYRYFKEGNYDRDSFDGEEVFVVYCNI